MLTGVDKASTCRYNVDMTHDELRPLLRSLLYDLEDENAITCRDRGEVAERIIRLLAETEAG